jgi:hypothetical protein
MPPVAEPLRLQLELDSLGDPIQGRIGHGDAGDRVAFSGWLELMAAIARLTGNHGSQDRRRNHGWSDG